ncbi:MAG: protein-L-isoaspartate O-methyltransferase [Gammaproteobacteria bacterium]|nr:protein-L-isoaspartate O-methyltransferase [Gammaproteobacteria bacterium]
MQQNLNKSHYNMIEQQVRPSEVLEPRVLEALKAVAREKFVSEDLIPLAYADTELPIGYGQTMLSPVIEGRMLQAIDVQPTEGVLEIGTGSGYFTALLAQLARQVDTVEIITELSEQAQQKLKGIENIHFHIGDASQGWDLEDRIDVIIATAAFVTVPDRYKQALQVGGRMLAAVGTAPMMEMQLIQRISEREWQIEAVFETVIPPMINAEPKAEFRF